MTSERSANGQKAKSSGGDSSSNPRASLDDLPRPSVFPLPATKSDAVQRPSIAPPAPPISHAPPAPTVHELFDVETADVDHARDAVLQRAAARASARPHPPRRSPIPGAFTSTDAANPGDVRKTRSSIPDDDQSQRLSTPLSWAAAKSPGVEEVSPDLLEPAVDSVPLALPPITAAEPLASAIPTGSVVVPKPETPKRPWGLLGAATLVAVGLVIAGSVLGMRNQPRAATSQPAQNQPKPAALSVAAATERGPAVRAPAPPLELDLGVPVTPPTEPAESATPEPAPATDPAAPKAPSAVVNPLPSTDEKPPFDQKAASAALSQAAASAAACRKPDDPTGSATVIVRYAPSGRVTSATVEAGPFAGTVTGGCVAMTFRKALVPPFSGDYVTVKKTVALK